MKDWLDDAMNAQRRTVAVRFGLLITSAAAAISVMSCLNIGQGVPRPAAMLGLTSAFAALTFAAHRGVRLAPKFFAWFIILAGPLIIVEPGVTESTDIAVFLPAVSALILADNATLAVAAIAPILILAGRARQPLSSPYLDPSVLAVYGVIIGAMRFAQSMMRRAVRDSLRTRIIEGAAARAGSDIIIWQAAPTSPVHDWYISATISTALGYARDGSEFRDPLGKVHADDKVAVRSALDPVLLGEAPQCRFECRLQHRDGRWLWFAARVFDLRKDPDVRGIVTSLQDISAERQLRDRHARQLVQQAEWDGLTLLPNRRRLTKDLADLAVPSTDNVGTWLLFCDFDAFKNINDTLGHDVGDELLRVAAQRLVDLATPHQAYRFGGDEFVIVLEASTREEAERLAARAVEVNKEPISVHEHQLTLTLSVGVARATTHGHESLLRDADLAMYAAKAAGKNRFLTFDEPMRATAMRRHLLGQALPEALRKGELRLVYQPRVDARTSQCVGFEALLRWRSATLGDVSPGEFIPVAEEAGLIAKLGAFVLREACMQLAAWRAQGLMQHVSVNVSVHQLAERERFVDLVQEVLHETHLPAECLELEVTESVFMKQPDVMVGVLRELRALGVTLAVDDFGTGYSSMAYIRTFPIQTLKIDRTFVGELENSRESRAITAAIMGLARELSIQTVAEGVESATQAELLRGMGCNELQGYHIARPLEPSAAYAFAQGTGERSSLGTAPAAAEAGEVRASSARVAH